MIISSNQLQTYLTDLFSKIGYEAPAAAKLADHLVNADLRGHHSHGLMRFPLYYKQIRQGQINPDATVDIEKVTPTIGRINAHKQIGQLAVAIATDHAIEMAKEAGIAVLGIHNVGHTGRVGTFMEQVVNADMVGMMFCNSGVALRGQAPYGGKDAKLSSNPIAFGAPVKGGPHIILDMATTAISHGKAMTLHNQGKPLPEYCALDKDGNLTIDPATYLDHGTLLPLGGAQGHKGFGLSLMVEIVAGILSQARLHSKQSIQDNNGGFLLVLNIAHFLPLPAYYEQIDAMIAELKSSALRAGFDEILLPGERANRTLTRQQKEGINIDDATWQLVAEYAEQLGIDAAAYI